MSETSRNSVVIETSMKESYLRYSMSVIVSRALPDVRDGLKPVHRRVLYAMHELGINATKPPKKSARIVGDVIGKYHPHGDSAVYETLVRLAQDFSLRYLLAEGQGNFGSVDGDTAAAMRYTEARMSRFSELMLEDLEKGTVDWAPNYDESEKEPTVLPAAFPNLLVNGSTGIAVGMATNMAPHNLREIVAAIRAYLADSEITSDELGEYVKGPDFPTGGIICGRAGFRAAYATGRGRVVVRARTLIETMANGRERIVAVEIPYMVNKATLLERIADLVRDKKIEGISDIRDESDRNGMRVVIELKRDVIADVVLNHLYKYTQFQTTFAINNLALVNRHPTVLPLKSLIRYYVDHRHDILVRRTQFELNKAQERAHILEGLLIAQANIDEVVAIIRSSTNVDEAKRRLEERFALSLKQSDAIVQMRLRALTSLESDKIDAEYKQQVAVIAECEEILSNEERRMQIIGDQLQEVADRYGDERRTTVEDVVDEIDIEDLIPNDPMVVTLSETGYVKRMQMDSFRSQGRGGVGVASGQLKAEDTLRSIFIANNHSFLLAFTNLGRVYWLKVYHIPESGRTSRGKAIVNLLNLSEDETVRQLVAVPGGFDQEDHFMVMATRNGTINKIALKLFSNPRRGGINAVVLEEGDELVSVLLSDQSDNMMVATRLGQAIVFPPTSFRALGRGTRGVRGIRLGDEDAVIGMVALESGTQVLTLTENGYGKRSPIAEYRVTNRGGKGIRNIMVTAKTGPAVGIAAVHEDWQVIVTTVNGTVIRTQISEISSYGRNSQGVRVVRLREGDLVQDMAAGRDESEIAEVEEGTATPKISADQPVVVEPTQEVEQ